jgi:hypothetical protein
MYHYADIAITWGIGVIKGIMDIVQTVDWERCKLPVVERESVVYWYSI